MANSPYKTFGNIYTAVLQDFKEQTSSTMVDLCKRWINEGQEQIIMRKKRDYLNTTFNYVLDGQVSTNFSIASGATTVTKTGTATLPVYSAFKTYGFKFDGFEEVYQVSTFSSTAITLASAYTGTTNTAASGVLFQTGLLVSEEIRSIHKVYHERDGQVLVMSKGPEDFKDIVQRDPSYTRFAQYWTFFGYGAQSVSVNPDYRKLLLYPYPESTYTIHLDVNLFIPYLTNSTDEPIVPLQHRQILYWYALMKLGQFHQDDTMIQMGLSNFNSWLDRLDGEFMPEKDLPRVWYDNTRWIGRRQFGRKLFRFDH